MEIKTVSTWSDELWHDASNLYIDAFGDKGAKPVPIIKNMLNIGISELHMAYQNSELIAMAITGILKTEQVMIIDYVTVSEKNRRGGMGKSFILHLLQQAREKGYKKVVIEVESENTQENRKRIRFWESIGFHLTSYVHHYVWVPETYQAMYYPLTLERKEETGESLFAFINEFHRQSFRGSKA